MQESDGNNGSGLFDVDLDLEARRHPQALYRHLRQVSAEMRAEGSVIRDGYYGVLVCTRPDVDEVLQHPQIFSSGMGAAPLGNVRPLIPLQIDPPEHKKFRKILDPLFAPQRMAPLENPVVRLVNELIDAFVDQEEIDFARQFTIPFPSQVILTLLGLPLEELPMLLRLKDGIIRPHHVVGTSLGDAKAAAYKEAIAAEIYDYFSGMLDGPQFGTSDGLLRRFLYAEVDGERLSREDILDICFLFLIAGLDTISATLECFFAYFAENPERRRELVADPAIIPRVVEELLRWETPVALVARIATQDSEIGGCPVAAGERVSVFIAGANTDEEEIPDAYEVRWDREANRHLTFGGGVHRCLGSHLARLVLRVTLREWHARIPHYRIKPGVELEFVKGSRALETFPMLLGVSV